MQGVVTKRYGKKKWGLNRQFIIAGSTSVWGMLQAGRQEILTFGVRLVQAPGLSVCHRETELVAPVSQSYRVPVSPELKQVHQFHGCLWWRVSAAGRAECVNSPEPKRMTNAARLRGHLTEPTTAKSPTDVDRIGGPAASRPASVPLGARVTNLPRIKIRVRDQ